VKLAPLLFSLVFVLPLFAIDHVMHTFEGLPKEIYLCNGQIDGRNFDGAQITFYPDEQYYVDNLRAGDVLNDPKKSARIKSAGDFQIFSGVAFSIASVETSYFALSFTLGHFMPYGFVYSMESAIDPNDEEQVTIQATAEVEVAMKEANELFDKFYPFDIATRFTGDTLKLKLTKESKEIGQFLCKKM